MWYTFTHWISVSETSDFNSKGLHVFCDQCCGIEQVFNEQEARRELRKYRRKGPAKSTRILIEALRNEELAGHDLLDIGGGIGAIQQELIQSGVSNVFNVDAASAFVKVSREEAERMGYADRVGYAHGNFVEIADDVDPADIVTLDRVICCFPDMHRLVSLSAEKAQRFYGIVFPRDTWWVHLASTVFNAVFGVVRRSPFKTFIHSTDAVDSLLLSMGLERRFFRTSGIWQIMVYARA
jgi:magnesium-protoporphyrin O-methyltransferase